MIVGLRALGKSEHGTESILYVTKEHPQYTKNLHPEVRVCDGIEMMPAPDKDDLPRPGWFVIVTKVDGGKLMKTFLREQDCDQICTLEEDPNYEPTPMVMSTHSEELFK